MDGSCVYEYLDEVCEHGCVAGGCRSGACQGQPVGTACDDENACTEQDACDADEVCRGSTLVCEDGNPCTSNSCDVLAGCQTESNTDPCDDGDPCSVADSCLDGACAGISKDCSDGLVCTDDLCLVDGSCDNPILGDSCLIAGLCAQDGAHPAGEACLVCDASSDPSDWTATPGAGCADGLMCNGLDSCDGAGVCQHAGNPCIDPCLGTCDEGSGACLPDPLGTLCDDGIACTRDACDVAGACFGVPDDSACGPAQACHPACSPDSTGCVDVPQVVVSCADTPSSSPAICTITTIGVDDQLDCLTCEVFIGASTIDSSDFVLDGQSGVCNLDGWVLDDGPCRAAFQPTECPFASSASCCQDFQCPASMPPYAGQEALQFEGGLCGNAEQWRLMKLFPFSGFEDVRVCIDYAWSGGGPESAFQLQIDNGNQQQGIDVLECLLDAALVADEPMRGCYFIPAAWLTIPLTRILLWFDIAGNGAAWLIDGVELTGWWPECPAAAGQVMSEDFTGCPLQLPADYNGWSVITNGIVECRNETCSDDLMRIRPGAELILERSVDTSGVDAQLELCWRMGGRNNGTVQFAMEMDAGSGWEVAYSYLGPASSDEDICAERCVELTGVNPAAADNPFLGLRFTIMALDERVHFDDIRLSGQALCDVTGSGLLRVDPLVQDSSDQYSIEIDNLDGRPFGVTVRCAWDERDPAVTGSDSFEFFPPVR